MKKIIAILLVMVVALGALAGCSSKSVSKADLESNPQKYIEEGIKTSLSKSPFGSILELKEPEATSIDVSIAPEDKDLGYIKLNSIIANKKLSALTTLDFNVEDEKIQGKLFVDAENLAVQSEALKEYFGTDAIGVGLKDVVEKFKKSGWYELIKESGLEEEFKSEMETEGLDKINFDDIVKAYEKYLNDSKAALEECKKYAVKEATLGKTKGFEVEETISEDIITKFDEIFNTFAKDLAKAIGVDAEEFGMEAMPDEIKDELKDIIKSYYTTYFIAQKTGAVLEIKTNLNIEVEDEEAYYFAKINFGENPTKMFQPTFEAEINDGSETVSIKGESTIDVKAKSFAMDVKLSTVEESANIKLTIDKDSNFKLEATDGDETVQIEGIFKVEDSKLQLSFDTSKVEDAEDVNIDINIDFNAKAPSSFKYDDLLEYDKKKVEDLITKFNDIIYNTQEDFAQSNVSGRVIVDDLADLLTDAEETALETSVQNKFGNQEYNVLFLTYDDANGKSTKTYTDDYMDNAFPIGAEDNIGFIIDMDNREIYINTMGEAIDNLSDSEVEAGLDAGYNHIQNQEYFKCLDAMAAYCIPRL